MTAKEKMVQQILELSFDMPSKSKFAHYLMKCTELQLSERLDIMEKDSDRRGAYRIDRRQASLL